MNTSQKLKVFWTALAGRSGDSVLMRRDKRPRASLAIAVQNAVLCSCC